MNEGEGVPLLNFEEGPGILLLNFAGGPGVQPLNFKEGSGSRFLGSWSHFYTMPIKRCVEKKKIVVRHNKVVK